MLSKNDPSSAAVEIIASIGEKLSIKFLLPLFIGYITKDA